MDCKRGCQFRGTSRGISRKGQVTVFIIIGIIILFTVAGILYFTKQGQLGKLETEQEPVIAEVPQEFQPLQSFTENCISQIGQRGLLILGEQGGYIYPDIVGEYSASNPTDADGLNLEPLKVPYWHYNKEPNAANKIAFASLQPKLYFREDPTMSIEAQLSRFVNEKIDSCLDNYNAFIPQGFQVQMGAKDTEVHVGENTVNFLLKMPVEAQKGEAKQTMEQFYVKIPLQLKHYYEVANQIAEAQRQYFFLEKQGMELISVYSDVDPNYFPPTSDFTFEFFSPYSWKESILKKKIQELLRSYIPMLRFLGSENFYYYTYPEGHFLAQKIADNMVLPLTGAEDLQLSFDYFGWEPYFKANSDENGNIKPDNIFVKYSVFSFGQQEYNTHYDASYPVLISIRDTGALAGAGYNFVFALESNIRNNKAAAAGEKPKPYPKPLSSLACGESFKDSEILKTVVVDSFTKEPLESVSLGFSIPNQESCDIGVTDKKGEVDSRYPSVYGGVINFLHPEYLTDYYPIDTVKYQEQGSKEFLLLGHAVAGITPEKIIEMDKIVTKKVKVKKKSLEKCIRPVICSSFDVLVARDISCDEKPRQCFFNQGQNLFGSGSPVLDLESNGSDTRHNEYYFVNQEKSLQPYEQVTFTLERVKGFHDEIIGDEFIAPITVQGDNAVDVDLVPGIYKVTAMSTLEKEIVIPSEVRKFQYRILTRDAQTEIPFDESRNKQYLSSVMEWDSPETYIQITPEELYTSNEITFYILTQDIEAIPEKTKVGDRYSTTTQVEGTLGVYGAVGTIFGGGGNEIINGRVVEDLQVPGQITEVAKMPSIRRALEPKFK